MIRRSGCSRVVRRWRRSRCRWRWGGCLGYRWPEQAESDDLDELADEDGIVCLPSVLGERTAADRLHGMLAAAYGEDVVAGPHGRAARGRGVEEEGPGGMASGRLLQGALSGVQEPSVRLAYLGWPQGRLRRAW